ncbi:MAG: signal peptidase II [Candidatus Binataceae bacterium]
MSGASIEPVRPRAAAAPSRLRVIAILLGLVAAPVLILDQLSKAYVASHMALYETIAIVPNWFDITYTRNPGAAFSMFVAMAPWIRAAMLLGLAIVAIIVLLVLIARSRVIDINSIAFALILAGASGNLIDRIARGQVIDFLRAHYYDLNYPVFNIADSAISIGVVMVILASFISSPARSAESPSLQAPEDISAGPPPGSSQSTAQNSAD